MHICYDKYVDFYLLFVRFLTVLSWFWTALSHFSKEDMAKFVQFVTGSSVLPPGGWKELSPKFQIGFTGKDLGPGQVGGVMGFFVF